MSGAALALAVAEWLGLAAILWLVRINASFKRAPLVFKYPRREGWVAGGLTALALALSVVFYVSLGANAGQPGTLAALWQRMVLAAGLVLIGAAALLVRRQPARSAGLGPKAVTSLSLKLGLSLVFLTVFLRGKVFAFLNGFAIQEVYALGLLLICCLFEEWFFRGYVQPRLSAWLGDRYGLLVTALSFTVWQLPRLLLNPAALAMGILAAVVQGLMLGWLAQYTGHVLAGALYRAASEWMEWIS